MHLGTRFQEWEKTPVLDRWVGQGTEMLQSHIQRVWAQACYVFWTFFAIYYRVYKIFLISNARIVYCYFFIQKSK